MGWTRAHAWLIASMAISLTGAASGFVSDRIGQPAWLDAVSWICVVAGFVCLVVFAIEWRRYRATQKARAERLSE